MCGVTAAFDFTLKRLGLVALHHDDRVHCSTDGDTNATVGCTGSCWVCMKGVGEGVGGGQHCERRKVRHKMARNEHRPTGPTFRIELTVTYKNNNNNNNARANNTKNCINTLSYMGGQCHVQRCLAIH